MADNFSGIERFAACLAIEMVKDKTNNFILLFKESIHSLFETIANQQNAKCVVLPRCNKLVFNQVRLPLAILKYEADYYLFLAFPVPILLFKKNMVSTIHDICCWDCPETMNGMSSLYFKLSHKIAMLKCKSIITISEFSKKRIIDKLGYDENKLWLIYCGIGEKFLNYRYAVNVDMEVKKKYRLPDKYILSLSTLEPRKNLNLLIDAYTELVSENKIDIPLVLAGRKGWKMDELLSGIEKSLKDNIIFTGFVDDEDLAEVYGNADLFVFPSMYEGFGMPPVEAMSVGTRVISSDSSSLPEVLGDATIYFKNQDREDLKEKILLILEQDEYEKNIQIEGGLKNSNKYRWSVFAQNLLELLK